MPNGTAGIVRRVGQHPAQLLLVPIRRGVVQFRQPVGLAVDFKNSPFAAARQFTPQRQRLPPLIIDLHYAVLRTASSSVLSSSLRAQTRSESKKADNS